LENVVGLIFNFRDDEAAARAFYGCTKNQKNVRLLTQSLTD
jgi:hypothetical protein